MAMRCSSSDSSARFLRGSKRNAKAAPFIGGTIISFMLGLAVFSFAACSPRTTVPEPIAEPPKPEVVTVLSLADFHGALEPRVLTTAGGDEIEVGGAGLIAAYVDRIREQSSGPVVLVDSGDMWQGTLVSNLQEGAPIVRFYNELSVAAAALGNHEFDFGPAGTDRVVPLSDDDDPRGALKERIKEADFPILGANVRNLRGTTPCWLEAETVVEEAGVRVGIVGGATIDTPRTTVVQNVEPLEFLALPGPIEEGARRLRDDGADVVVAVVHAGGGCEDNSDPDDLTSCRDGELFDLVKALPEGLVDVFAGGHSHAGIAKRINGSAVIQPFAQGQYLGMATVYLDGSRPPTVAPPIHLCGAVVDGPDGPTCSAYHVRRSDGPVRPAVFMGREIAPDQAVLDALASDFALAEQKKKRSLGVEVSAPVGRAYGSESALGNLVSDVLLASVPDADAAMINGGGLRAELPAGPLTYGDLFSALPFDNRVAVLTVDGATLRRIVEHGHAGGHSALSWAGLVFEAEGCEVKTISVGGSVLDDDEGTYRVVTNNFLATGGSGFSRLEFDEEQVEILWDLPPVRELVARSLGSWDGPIVPRELYDPESPRLRIEGKCER